jgi:hypothetical protein
MFHDCTITANRGYAKIALVKQLSNRDIGVILFMSDHFIACQPFVVKSYF